MNALHIHVFPALEQWTKHSAQAIAEEIQNAASRRGRAFIALSGGHTPKPVYKTLTRLQDIPWDRVYIFWGDERYVPHHDPRSNYRMARETLLQHISIPEDHIFPMPTHHPSPEEGARAYERTIRERVEDGRFDVILLGLGTDCHTASLFPGTPALEETRRWVVPNQGPDIPRLTFTFALINRAHIVFFLATGEQKYPVVQRVLYGEENISRCPARGVRPQGEAHWWLDGKAGPRLPAG